MACGRDQLKLTNVAGIYIHIPFCRSRCTYCDFYSTTLPPVWQVPYVRAVCREMELRESEFSEYSEYSEKLAPTIYLGGGTPSQLSREALLELFGNGRKLSRLSHLSPRQEITIEANPDDVIPEWIETLKRTPVNRVSMGVQSLDDNILRTLRRRHTSQQALHAIKLLQEAGYHNLSIDLIYGLPGQRQKAFRDDVCRMLDTGIPHLSAYALQFEQGTPLYEQLQKGQVEEADEELSLSCYETLMDLTHKAGMEHYEISNFARPGFRSRHNSSYWTGTPYVGLGAGAHSYDGHKLRSSNCEDVTQYIRNIGEGKRPCEQEMLDEETLYNEMVMLRLRTCEGLSLEEVEDRYGKERRIYLTKMAQSHMQAGRLTNTADGHLRLTRRGLFVSDDIISDLMV